ncbi:hypothetical protein [Dethiosulfatarculus sandiegensis]|uniref:DUF4177 domain-containing protein n=1 Tax=Dethiosulfatarculus sandiegensis TaxID=1429043 RepID=A0A0D2GDC3_9BACT|nr:hypothetical protein [Dethiosulfatarculus sandiegensis]KIX12947.1 hypothetical protein X474_16755 [Dethiosulfatarculus sandiegensis]
MIKQWQYMSVWVDRDWKVQTIVGEDKGAFGPKTRFVEFLNKAGRLGWELINILPVEVGNRAFFKRPVNPDEERAKDEEIEPESMELDSGPEDLFELDQEDI